MDRLPFREVWLIDFEFTAPDGETPDVRCMVAAELHTGRMLKFWLMDEPLQLSPFETGPDVLFVAYGAVAEMLCFVALGWSMPTHLLDLHVEFRWLTCGIEGETAQPSLIHALDRFGLPSLDATEKDDLRKLSMRDGPYSPEERQALLKYCETDVQALAKLLPRMLPRIDLPRAILRGRFIKVAAQMEFTGIPIDTPTLAMLDEHWEDLQDEMVRHVDADFGVYDGIHFRVEQFARWLCRQSIPWPRLLSGELALDAVTFRDQAAAYSILQPLHQLRQALDMLRLADLPVGRDGRNRCWFAPFGTITGRCAPSTSKFIMGRPAWMRSLIKPQENRALAYIDWSSQEYGIGAVLSGDNAMIADYEAGDPYLGFAKRIGIVPESATKKTHRADRDTVKAVILGTQYGMGEKALSIRINKPVAYARELLQAHRNTYRKFWDWSDAAVNVALFRGRLWTRYGWQTHVRYRISTDTESGDPNTRSLSNFPCQANAADMLRLAAILTVKAGVSLNATVHDALLIESEQYRIEEDMEITRDAMNKASELVLSGFRLRTDDPDPIYFPDRYVDDRGIGFFTELVKKLKESSHKWRGVRQQWTQRPPRVAKSASTSGYPSILISY